MTNRRRACVAVWGGEGRGGEGVGPYLNSLIVKEGVYRCVPGFIVRFVHFYPKASPAHRNTFPQLSTSSGTYFSPRVNIVSVCAETERTVYERVFK